MFFLPTVSAFTANINTVVSRGCLSFFTTPECMEDVASGDFAIVLLYGVGECQAIGDFSNFLIVTAPITSSPGVCIDVGTRSIIELCYTATLTCRGVPIMSQTNLDFRRCAVFTLEAQLASGITYTLSSAMDGSETVPHITIATLICACSSATLVGDSEVLCLNGVWEFKENVKCSGI